MTQCTRWVGMEAYIFTNDRGSKAIVLVGHGVWLYPAGLDEYGRAVAPGHQCAGLLSAQIEAIEILSHD